MNGLEMRLKVCNNFFYRAVPNDSPLHNQTEVYSKSGVLGINYDVADGGTESSGKLIIRVTLYVYIPYIFLLDTSNYPRHCSGKFLIIPF